MLGSSGADRVVGGNGDDQLFGGQGKERVFGETDDDFINLIDERGGEVVDLECDDVITVEITFPDAGTAGPEELSALPEERSSRSGSVRRHHIRWSTAVMTTPGRGF